METLLVRLKPYDKRRGQLLRSYSFSGIRFDASCGWYRVEKPVGDYLREVFEQPGDPYTPKAFYVCATEDEARTIDAAEQVEAPAPRGPGDPLQVVTTPAVAGGPVQATATTQAAGAPVAAPPAQNPPAAGSEQDRRNKRDRE